MMLESSEFDKGCYPLNRDELAAREETNLMVAALKHSNSVCDEQDNQEPSAALDNFNLGSAP